MERPLTEVQKFIKETQRQIDEEGLLAMSGTNFSKGDKPIRVLKAKQYEARVYSDMSALMGGRKGKFSSIARIAQQLNAMNEAIKNGDYEELTFNDSQIGKGKSCGPNCECYPNEVDR